MFQIYGNMENPILHKPYTKLKYRWIGVKRAPVAAVAGVAEVAAVAEQNEVVHYEDT